MAISAKIIADSISEHGKRITSLQLKYHRFIHAEFMTHRVFGRNASSSRAIPVSKMIDQVRNDPAMPIHWGKNQPGMQANEQLTGDELAFAQYQWRCAANEAATIAEAMQQQGLHKQVANRILEPYQWIHVVVTATEWDNFFELRAHEDAQPEIHELAIQMRDAMRNSIPQILGPGEWHLPYVTAEDMGAFGPIQTYLRGASGIEVWNDEMKYAVARKVSAARTCRVSYLKHDGTPASIPEELGLCNKLVGSRPLHASPFEHQATPDTHQHEQNSAWRNAHMHGNLVGWIQNRKLIEHEFAQ